MYKKNDEFKKIDTLDPSFISYLEQLYTSLTVQQKIIVWQILSSSICPSEDSFNMYVTGGAGCGKSFAIRVARLVLYLRLGNDSVAVCSPTGLAARNVEGQTLHKLFKLKFNESMSNAIANIMVEGPNTSYYSKLEVKLKVLIIDEISLLTGSDLDDLNRCLIELKRTNKPFGGLFVLLAGDHLQLPPIVDGSKKQDKDNFKKYFFEAEIFQSGFSVYYLKQNMRQGTQFGNFVDICNRARRGELTQDDCDYVNNQCGRNIPKEYMLAAKDAADATFRKEMETIDGARTLGIKITSNYLENRVGNGHNETRNNNLRTRIETFRMAEELRKSFDDATVDAEPLVITIEKLEEAEFNKLFSVRFERREGITTFEARDFDQHGSSLDNISADLKAATEIVTGLPSVLNLTKGKRVLVTYTGVSHWLVKNMLGVVENFDANYIQIRPIINGFPTSKAISISRKKLEFRSCYQESKHFKRIGNYRSVETLKCYSRMQFPIVANTIVNIFVIQGQTGRGFPILFVNERMHKKDGQGVLYVAMTRHADPRYFATLHKIVPADAVCDLQCKEFDNLLLQEINDFGFMIYKVP